MAVADVQSLADSQQLCLPGELFDDELHGGKELLTLDADAEKYPGSTIDKQIQRRDAILDSIAEGQSLRRIQKVWKVGYYTIKALERRSRVEIAARKERLSNKAELVAELCIDRLIEDVDKLPPQTLAITTGIMIDKSLLLRGEASTIVEHQNKTTAQDFRAKLQEARREFVEVEAVPVTEDTTGLTATKENTKELAEPPGDGRSMVESQADQDELPVTKPADD
jgi:hypothetical protein